ncbi:DVU_1555 family C-GCAxxG-C-C protein [Fusibacter ferrireducens]|uniref:C_GCAxxG_C_C family protein n=1 Tax=Fusibacter ferrireducens TaxID=2785058 RepID=A0ABR9ZUA8_9FIRM|nr:DV_1555 family C-GCAxxG-C-C protein [Fusibacter ferrireducens]MBF4694061.1 C_GCAxxG_C_C family protein [Fusibacter ferrireducens]
MSSDMMRILELSQSGFCCSQILLMMGLEEKKIENKDLIRAMGGLCGGVGGSANNCGALTGGACLLSLYTGRGAEGEVEMPFAKVMMDQLIQWFNEEIGALYGGINCIQILENNPMNRMERCPALIEQVYDKVEEILEAYDHTLSEIREDIL